VVASLAGIKDLFSKQELSARFTEEDRADGKIVLITGANSGLGFSLAVDFAKRGAKVIMAGRSKIPEAGERVKKLAGSEQVEMRYLDLSKIETIHSFVRSLADENVSLDICILNAAVALPGSRRTASGLDELFLVNYLSNVILTQLLLKSKVIRLLDSSTPSKLLFISSDSHQGASYIDYDEFGDYFDYGVSKAISNYSYFKLVLNTYATELSNRINQQSVKLSINLICPGPVHSNIVKEAPWVLRMILKGVFWVVFKSPAKAARPVVYMALSSDFDGTTNQYLHMFNKKKMDPKVYQKEQGEKLWERSMELIATIDPSWSGSKGMKINSIQVSGYGNN
jgi:NAD(P)-dependent dehydrogenase (short-subunit alcohol dehydrogenase family)